MFSKKTTGFGWNNITKLALVFFFSNLYFYSPIITLFYQQRGLNMLQINSLQGIVLGTIFLTNIPTGVFADKYGRKNAMILAMLLQLISVIFFLFAHGYLSFIVICIIAGLANSFLAGTVSALIFESLKNENNENDMQKAVGLKVAFASAASIIAPLAVSFYITSFSMDKFNSLVIFTIMSLAIGLVFTLLLKEPPHAENDKKKISSLRIIKSGIQTLRNNSKLQKITLISVFAYPLTVYLYLLFQPYFVKAQVPSSFFGLSLAIASLISLIASKYTYKIEQKLGMGKTILLVTIVPSLLFLSMAFISHSLLSPLLFCLIYFPAGMYEPLFSDYQNRQIEGESRVTVLSMIGMLLSAYIVIAGLIIGYLADISLTYAFIFMGVTIITGASIFQINKKSFI